MFFFCVYYNLPPILELLPRRRPYSICNTGGIAGDQFALRTSNLYYGRAMLVTDCLRRGHPRPESENDQDLVRLHNQIDEYFVGSSIMDLPGGICIRVCSCFCVYDNISPSILELLPRRRSYAGMFFLCVL